MCLVFMFHRFHTQLKIIPVLFQAILGGKTKSRGLDGEMEINVCNPKLVFPLHFWRSFKCLFPRMCYHYDFQAVFIVSAGPLSFSWAIFEMQETVRSVFSNRVHLDCCLHLRPLSLRSLFYFLLLLQIPPGAQSHQQMRLTGKGIQRLNGFGKGDHYLNIKIHLPK